jgi:MFS family permease
MYYAGAPLIGPAVETLLLKSRANRGAVVGMQSSVATICRVLSPVVLGALYSVGGYAASYGCAALAALVAVLVLAQYQKELKR